MTTNNGADPQQDTTDWHAEAQFWQLKYFELMIHSNQVVTALSRPMLGGLALLQQAAQQAAQVTQQVQNGTVKAKA